MLVRNVNKQVLDPELHCLNLLPLLVRVEDHSLDMFDLAISHHDGVGEDRQLLWLPLVLPYLTLRRFLHDHIMSEVREGRETGFSCHIECTFRYDYVAAILNDCILLVPHAVVFRHAEKLHFVSSG